MKKIKGQLLNIKPYKICSNGSDNLKVALSRLSGFKIGDQVYQVKLPDGSIMLIPEKEYSPKMFT